MSVLRRRFVPSPPSAAPPAKRRRARRPATRAPRAPLPSIALAMDTPGMEGDMLDIVLPAIRRLAAERKTAVIRYVAANGVETTREVEPYREWSANDGRIMLTTWCRMQQAVRHFDLSRVQSVTDGSPFDPRGDIQIPPPDAEDPV